MGGGLGSTTLDDLEAAFSVSRALSVDTMTSTSPAGPLCTRFSLARALSELGVEAGDVLLVHSSLSSLGFVNGSAEAVVQTMPLYNQQTTRTSGMGVILETVRTWPFAVRSAHPQTSFAAVGRRAHSLMEDHALDCRLGEQSPLAKLEKHLAKILLLGVGFGCCTAFHPAEYRVQSPIVDNGFSVKTPEGPQWMTVRNIRLNEERFDELGAAFEKEHDIICGKVGAADARLFSLRKAVKFAEK